MKEIKPLIDVTLVTELLRTMVCEKSDLIWALPYSDETQDILIKELFLQFPVSEN